MKPLLTDKAQGNPKHRTVKSKHVDGYTKGVSNYDKLTTKNANRAMTKGARQQSKRQLKFILNNISL